MSTPNPLNTLQPDQNPLAMPMGADRATVPPAPIPQPSAPLNLGTPNKIHMKFDDGTEGDVPSARVADATKDGGRVTTHMYFDDGTENWVPLDRVHDALKDGGTLGYKANGQPISPAQTTSVALGDNPLKAGYTKAAMETLHTAGAAAGHLMPNSWRDSLGLPSSFKEPDYLTSSNGAETAGKVAENIAEYTMGDEALKGLQISERLGLAKKLADMAKNSPYVARMLELGMNATREGSVAGVQGTAHSGDIKQGVEQGVTAGVLSGTVGTVSKPLGEWLRARGYAGETLDRAATVLQKESPSLDEVATSAKAQLDASEDTMHDTYDKFINGFRDKVGNEVIAMKDTPLYKAATDIANANSHLPAEVREGLEAVTPQTTQLKKLLSAITESPSPDAGVTGNYLIDLRQGLNRSIKTADPANKQVLSHLLGSVDETLDNLVPDSSKEYAVARGAYKDTLSNLNQPFVKALRAGKIADVTNSLTTGANPEFKIKTLRSLIGDDAVTGMGASKFAQVGKDALDDSGHLDVQKFVESWRGIKQSVRQELFRNAPDELNAINQLVDNAKSVLSTANKVKWGVRGLGAASSLAGAIGLGNSDKDHPVSPYAYMEIVGGLIGLFGGGKSHEITETLLSNPKVLQSLGKLGGYTGWTTHGVPDRGTSTKALGKLGVGARGGIAAGATHLFNPDTQQVEKVQPATAAPQSAE